MDIILYIIEFMLCLLIDSVDIILYIIEFMLNLLTDRQCGHNTLHNRVYALSID